MNDAILCLVAFCFLLWVLILTSEVAKLKADNRKLRAEVERLMKLAKAEGSLKVTPYPWAKKSSVQEDLTTSRDVRAN
jgi:hypothetical protein